MVELLGNKQVMQATEAEICYLSVGMWSSRGHKGLTMLILPSSFVFLADSTSGRATSRAAVLQQLGAKSPFNSSYYTEGSCICAFEVPLDSIVGMDYHNPLLQPGRVVLEVHHVRKREFRTMESAQAYYLSDSLRFGGGCGAEAEGEGQPARCLTTPLRDGVAATQPQPQPAATRKPGAVGTVGSEALGPVQAGSGALTLRKSQKGARQGLLSRLEATALVAPPGDAGSSGVGSMRSRSSSGGSLVFRPSLDEGREGGAAGADSPAAASSSGCSPRMSAAGSWLNVTAAVAAQECVQCAGGARCATDTGASGAADGEGPGSPRRGAECALVTPADLPLHVGSALALGASSFLAASPCSRPGPPPGAVAEQGRSSASEGGAAAEPRTAGVCMRHARSTGDLVAAAAAATSSSRLWSQQESAPGPAPPDQSPGQVLRERGPRQPRELGSPQLSWPSPWEWTTVSDVYEFRTIIFQFTSPELPQLLRPVIQGNERLLKMYESGLPTWAIFMPAYGFYYRPYLRTLTWLLYYAFSVFSLACGFLDLYKNLPGVQLLFQRMMSSMWLPPAAILLWLDQHAQFRLSILLTYIFGKSETFVQIMRWVGNVARGVRVALRPAADALGPPLAALCQAARLLGLQGWRALAGVWLGVGSLLYTAIAPFAQLVVDVWRSLAGALAPLAALLYGSVVGPVGWALATWRHLHSAAAVLWVGLAEAGRGVAAGASAVKVTVSAGKAVHRSSPDVVSQVAWLYVIPSDVYELLHNSALKVMRALQTVAKFLVQMGCNLVRHRQSLGLRLERALGRGRRRLAAWLALPGRALVAVVARLMRLVQTLLWLAVLDADGGGDSPSALPPQGPAAGQGDVPAGAGAGASGKVCDPSVAIVAADASAGGAGQLRHRGGSHWHQAGDPGQWDGSPAAGAASPPESCGECDGCMAAAAAALPSRAKSD